MDKVENLKQNDDNWIQNYELIFEDDILNKFGNALKLYREARKYYLNNDLKNALKLTNLNKIFNNCIVPYTAKIGYNSHFAYNGFGILIHNKSIIGDYVSIGTQVLIGHQANIKNYVYIGAGAKILKDVHDFCIVGANAVVTKSFEPFSIIAGTPAKVINKINYDNIKEYIKKYFKNGHSQELNIEDKIYSKFTEIYDKYKEK